MKRRIVLLCMIFLFLCGCTNAADEEETELTVFVAASLTESLTEIAEQYEADNPGVSIRFNFDSSGTLKTQIEEGAQADLFLSAAHRAMDELSQAEGIDPSTRVDLLKNKVVLAVPEGNPKQLTDFDMLFERLATGELLFAIGNEDVPVGQYTRNIIASYGLDEAALDRMGVLTYGSNVKEVTTQVKEASVDAGVIYATDAFSAGLTVIDEASEERAGQVVYPAAVLANANNREAARAFLDALTKEEALQIFESVGFSRLR